MNELSRALQRQAGLVSPEPNLEDVLQRVHQPQQSRRVGRFVAFALATVAVIATVGAVMSLRTSSPRSTISPSPPGEIDIGQLGGMLVGDVPAGIYLRGTLVRFDPASENGSHSIVVRRLDGSLNQGTAVVTYPIDGLALEAGVIEMNATTGAMALVSPVTGGRVVVRGVGLTRDEILAIADATVILDGRPVLGSTSAMAAFAVVATGPLHPRLIHEARIGCTELGEQDALGTMCYTGLTTSPGFEDALYSTDFQPGPTVDGLPSVVSKVGGGSMTLAWELQPGVIAFVGYSGNTVGEAQVAALARLAGRVTLSPPSDWSATEPQTVTQVNDWS